mgnify:CR=1 FL=1
MKMLRIEVQMWIFMAPWKGEEEDDPGALDSWLNDITWNAGLVYIICVKLSEKMTFAACLVN